MVPAIKGLWAGDHAEDSEFWSFPSTSSAPKPGLFVFGAAADGKRLTIDRRTPSRARREWARPLNAARGELPPRNRTEVYAQQAEWIHENPKAEVVLQAIRIGELGITAIPNEVYGITGLKLKRQSPMEATFNLELSNGAVGYIPPPEQHRLGGYTTWPARTAASALVWASISRVYSANSA